MTALASRVGRGVLRHSVLVTLALLIGGLLVRSERPREIVPAHERTRLHELTNARLAQIRAERCPRAAMRSSALQQLDGTPLLAGLVDSASTQGRCLEVARKHRGAVEGCGREGCTRLALAQASPIPEVLAACAPLYDAIAQNARATETCSPWSIDVRDPIASDVRVMSLPFAIKVQVASLYAAGDLGAAAMHITNAMRFADDYGRKGYVVASMFASAMLRELARPLDEILVDPRLTAADARAIARDLDVLLVTAPTFVSVMRQEFRFATSQLAHAVAYDAYLGDPAQDEALHREAAVRWLDRVENACAGVPLRPCVETLRATPAPFDDTAKLRLLARMTTLSDTELRAAILEQMTSMYEGLFASYAEQFAMRQLRLTASRMQAELRTMSATECRDPAARAARLAPWLHDGITLTDGPEPLLHLPAWMQPPALAHRRKPTPPHQLRCVTDP